MARDGNLNVSMCGRLTRVPPCHPPCGYNFTNAYKYLQWCSRILRSVTRIAPSARAEAICFWTHRDQWSNTAKALRVNYNALRKRVEHQAATAPRRPEENSVTTFLELAPPPRVGSCQCTMELEDDSGAKMRVHLQSPEAPDLAALSRSFWELRS